MSAAKHGESESERVQRIVESDAYRRADVDLDFLARPELRPLRLQLEFLKTDLALTQAGIEGTVVVFGGTHILPRRQAEARVEAARAALEASPEDPALARALAVAGRILAKCIHHEQAEAFARLAARHGLAVVTGGGPGIMEAANRGAFEAGGASIGLNIKLPEEQWPNPYITPELCFQFRYFALRKMHFLLRARALVCFPGGFGTIDELFDALTLRQTERMQPIPIVLFGRAFWERAVDFAFLADEGTIRDQDLTLFHYAETAAEAWDLIRAFPGSDTAPW